MRSTFNLSVIGLLLLIIGFLAGFFAYRYLPVTKQADQSKLPISQELLRNPLIYEWRGSVAGNLVAKDKYTFTLKNDKGNSLDISTLTSEGQPWSVKFFLLQNNAWQEASLSAIPVGTKLRGDFFIFKGNNNLPVGNSFRTDTEK